MSKCDTRHIRLGPCAYNSQNSAIPDFNNTTIVAFSANVCCRATEQLTLQVTPTHFTSELTPNQNYWNHFFSMLSIEAI